ncbi:hypothetical protein ACI2L1_39790 [Streptomyces sp. NPDC019531]
MSAKKRLGALLGTALQSIGWNAGSVSFVYPNGSPEKQLWATI